MTAKKDLKRRIRERQAKTHESYVTARRHVLAAASPEAARPPDPAALDSDTRFGAEAAGDQAHRAIVVEEMVDLTAAAESLGFRCRVMSSSTLAAKVAHATLLDRMRAVLHGTTEDPEMERMRAICLRGESPAPQPRTPDWLEKVRQFVARAHVGVGGLSHEGAMLAFNVDGVMVLANTGFRPGPLPPAQRPRLVFSAIVEEGFSMSMLLVR
jgi:hypothetical protein